MKRALTLFLYLGIFSVTFATSMNFESWNYLQKSEQFSLLQHKTQSNTFIAITTKQDDDISLFLKDKSQLKLDMLVSERNHAMQLIGISKWRSNRSEWVKNTNIIRISGQYVDHKGLNVNFIEYHLFEKNEVIQILISSPKLKAIENSEQLKQVLASYRIKL